MKSKQNLRNKVPKYKQNQIKSANMHRPFQRKQSLHPCLRNMCARKKTMLLYAEEQT